MIRWSAARARAWRASCSTLNNSARKGGSLARCRGRICLAIQVCQRDERVCMSFLQFNGAGQIIRSKQINLDHFSFGEGAA